MEGYKVKMNEENIKKDEIITPEQTGEIVRHEVETTSAEEKPATESNPDKVHELEENVDKANKDTENAGEKPGENIENASQGDTVSSNDNTGEVSAEDEEVEVDIDKKEETSGEEEEKKDQSDEKPEDEQQNEVQEEEEKKDKDEDEVQQPQQDEVDIEQLKKELDELKAEKEEEAKVKELVDVAHQVEVEYDRVVKGINEALRETLEQYQIPTDKTIQELQKEDPAKAEMAKALIAQAKQALEFNTQQLSNTYKTKEQDVIFTKAERLFNKYEMSNEQAQVAADTFISILQATGLQDLDEDLSAKVELSVAQARFKVPTVDAQSITTAVKDAKETTVQEENVEPEAATIDEKASESKPEEETSKVEEKPAVDNSDAANDVEIKKGVAKRTVDLSGYREGIDGGNVAAQSTPDTSDVLHKLASLPFKERQAFLKQNFALINKAMREVNIKNARDRK